MPRRGRHNCWERPESIRATWRREGNTQRYTRLIPPGIGYLALQQVRASKELGGYIYWEAVVVSEDFRLPLGTVWFRDVTDVTRAKRWASERLRTLRDALAGRGDRCPF